VIDWQAVSAARLPFVVGACLPGVVAPSAIAEGRWVPRAACMPDALSARQRRRTDAASRAAWPKSGHLAHLARLARKESSTTRGHRAKLAPLPEIYSGGQMTARPEPDAGMDEELNGCVAAALA
jgi:hypothetical protein